MQFNVISSTALFFYGKERSYPSADDTVSIFYGCWQGKILGELFYAVVSLTMMVSNYIQYKNVSSQSFLTGNTLYFVVI